MKKLLHFTTALWITLMLLFAFSTVSHAAQSGSCGDNITWELSDSGLLTISGKGDMVDFSSKTDSPWYSFRTEIRSVTIQSGVASIGDHAFNSCTNLTKVSIPKSVTAINDYAFYACSSLSSITIPEGVTSIGYGTFANCTNLSAIAVPDSVKHIDYGAFHSTAYYKNNSNWDDGALYINKHLLYAPVNVSGTYKVKNGTKTIACDAFYNRADLTGVIIPDSVTSIGIMAFEWCDNLTSVYITDLAAWCDIDFYTESSNPMYNGANLYVNNKLLTTVKITDDVKRYTFNGCKSLTEVTFSKAVTSIGYGAFAKCTALKALTIPDNITTISDAAFDKCSTLTKVTLSEGLASIGGFVFSDCTSLTEITIPDSITSIGEFAFADCTALEAITIQGSITNIGECAFYNCPLLSDVYITDLNNWCNIDFVSIESNPLCSGAVLYVDNKPLTTFEGFDELTKIKDYTFYGCTSLTSVTLSDNVTSIGTAPFSYCSNLSIITIPDSVTSNGDSFCGTAYYNDDNNWTGAVLYINNHLVDSKDDIQDSYIIKDGTKTIADGTFYNCRKLTVVTIPHSVIYVGDNAFEFCTRLEEVNFGTGVAYIGNSAFTNCISLIHLILPGNLTYLGDFAFDGCKMLANYIILPRSLTYLGHSSFKDCENILSVYIPSDNITEIKAHTFSGCDSLTNVYLPDSITTIDYNAFYRCYYLDYVYYTGSESQWHSIDIDYSNSDSLRASFYTYDYVFPQPEITNTSATLRDDTVTAAYYLSDASMGGVIFAALINDNGEMVDFIKTNPYEFDNLTFEKGKTGTSVKLFWWESAENMTPLCSAKTVIVEQYAQKTAQNSQFNID